MAAIAIVCKRYRVLLAAICATLLAIGLAFASQASPAAHAAPLQAPACATGTNVTTTDGPVCGITVSGVNEWLGIP
jgi:para-nitrobenzyl esterase